MPLPDPRPGLWALVVVAGIQLAGCGTAQKAPSSRPAQDSAPQQVNIDIDSIADAVPREEPRSRYGNPDSYVVFGKRYHTFDKSDGFSERGIASWYGTKFHGRRTSSGEPYDMFAMTAAHKHLPLPCYVEVTNLKNNRRIVVRVNDRGPFHEGRIIDLSYVAAAKLDMLGKGTAPVQIRVVTADTVELPNVARAEPDSSPKPPAPDDGTTGVYLQVGAFSSRDNAGRLKQRIHAAEIADVIIETQQRGEDPLYRVRVGPIANLQDVETIARQLRDLGLDTHRIGTTSSKDTPAQADI